MAKRWYVIDADENLTSWNEKKDAAEFFGSLAAAARRARELAQSEPGKEFLICETVSVAKAEVSPATITKV